MELVFTFWEGKMPAYVKLCMRTWTFPYILLNYSNIHNMIDLDIDSLSRFSLPQIADYIRVHVLRDYGGTWMDTDTIILNGKLPDIPHIIGNDLDRTNRICYLHTHANHNMYTQWADYQDDILRHPNPSFKWDVMGNAFTDKYLKHHKEILISDDYIYHPEYMLTKGSREDKYKQFYFEDHYRLDDIPHTDMLLLHNSWTPGWFRLMDEREVLKQDCTMSYILKEVMMK